MSRLILAPGTEREREARDIEALSIFQEMHGKEASWIETLIKENEQLRDQIKALQAENERLQASHHEVASLNAQKHKKLRRAEAIVEELGEVFGLIRPAPCTAGCAHDSSCN